MNNKNRTFGIVYFRPPVKGGRHLLSWSILSRCLSPSPHLRSRTDPVSETLRFLVFRIPNDVQGPETQWFSIILNHAVMHSVCHLCFIFFIYLPMKTKVANIVCFATHVTLVVQWLRLTLSMGPNRVGVSPPPQIHMRAETDPVYKTLPFLVFKIPDDGQTPKFPAIPKGKLVSHFVFPAQRFLANAKARISFPLEHRFLVSCHSLPQPWPETECFP
jgi:hypothetical protein